jgi:hypothetical protein
MNLQHRSDRRMLQHFARLMYFTGKAVSAGPPARRSRGEGRWGLSLRCPDAFIQLSLPTHTRGALAPARGAARDRPRAPRRASPAHVGPKTRRGRSRESAAHRRAERADPSATASGSSARPSGPGACRPAVPAPSLLRTHGPGRRRRGTRAAGLGTRGAPAILGRVCVARSAPPSAPAEGVERPLRSVHLSARAAAALGPSGPGARETLRCSQAPTGKRPASTRAAAAPAEVGRRHVAPGARRRARGAGRFHPRRSRRIVAGDPVWRRVTPDAAP